MKPLLGLAPMDGFTDAACRCIAQEIRDQYGDKNQYDFCLWTEFMTADGFIRNPEGVKHHLNTTPNQTKLIAQIFGGNQETLVQTAATLQKDYADRFTGIELNMGCPANNVMKSGGGAELLKNKENSLEIIKAMRNVITMPFSIKTRIGSTNTDKEDQIAFLCKTSPYVDMITIHARTTAEGYGPNLDRDFIYILKQLLPSQKIIGNGGITSYTDIQSHLKNLDGIMIGQAAIGNPRVFTPHTPSLEEKKQTILKHLDLIPHDPRNLMEFRKHLYSYVKGIPGSKEFKTEANNHREYEDLLNHITNFFAHLD